MSVIRYYTDEQVAQAVIRGIRQRGIDVLSVPEADMLGAADEEHLALAYGRGRVVFTQDADFLRLAASGYKHAGIVYGAQRKPIGELIRGLVLIHQIFQQKRCSDVLNTCSDGIT